MSPLRPTRKRLPIFGPSNPLTSADLRIMTAWLSAELAHPGDHRAVLAAVETAIRQAREGASRRVLGMYYYRVPDSIRPLLGQPEGEGLKQLLGRYARDGVTFLPGLAGLTERESEVYWLRIRGWSSSAIAGDLTPAERRGDRSQWVSVRTVYNHVREAKLKVLRAFGLKPDLEPSADW